MRPDLVGMAGGEVTLDQVHGAVRDALDHLRRVLDVELNSATDNPLVFPEGGVAPEDTIATGGGLVISGGNFHGEPIALALDFAKLAIAELGSISERRTALLLDGRLNGGLPAFLARASGLDSGLMLVQYTAAALASENKVLAHPASADSIPTSANQEDHVSMGATAARHARTVLEHVERIIGIELLCAAQALDLRNHRHVVRMAHVEHEILRMELEARVPRRRHQRHQAYARAQVFRQPIRHERQHLGAPRVAGQHYIVLGPCREVGAQDSRHGSCGLLRRAAVPEVL